MTKKFVVLMTSVFLGSFLLTSCTSGGLVQGTGYEHTPLSRNGAKLLINSGERKVVEVIASNNRTCKKHKGCKK